MIVLKIHTSSVESCWSLFSAYNGNWYRRTGNLLEHRNFLPYDCLNETEILQQERNMQWILGKQSEQSSRKRPLLKKVRWGLKEDNFRGGPRPQQSHSLVEKGCKLTLHRQNDVYAKVRLKRAHKVKPERAENVTVFGFENSLWEIFFKFKCRLQGRGWTRLWDDNESMATGIFKKCMHLFSNFKFPWEILDDSRCHFDSNVLDVAESNSFCLQGNCTRVYNF
jgi:hypothetical protein